MRFVDVAHGGNDGIRSVRVMTQCDRVGHVDLKRIILMENVRVKRTALNVDALCVLTAPVKDPRRTVVARTDVSKIKTAAVDVYALFSAANGVYTGIHHTASVCRSVMAVIAAVKDNRTPCVASYKVTTTDPFRDDNVERPVLRVAPVKQRQMPTVLRCE